MPVRKTKQSMTIQSLFAERAGPLSAVEVHEMARARVPSVGIATVYRQIGQLLQSGWLTEVKLGGEPSRFELAGKPHHHHFVCQGCRQVFEMPGCIGAWQTLVPPGFHALNHELTLYGFCATCAQT